MFIDSHTHLLHPRFLEEDPILTTADLLQKATEAKVTQLITIACRRQEWQPALTVASQYPKQVAVAVGIHPQDVAAEPTQITSLELCELAKNQHVVAFGETGLDYYYDTSPKSMQQTSFHTHLETARQAGLPVVIHTRDAEEDTIKILQEHPGVPFVLHCFTGTRWLAEEGLKLGGYLSFSGILTFKKSQELRDIAAATPHNRVLIETDAPYLAPEPFRSKRNASFFLPHTAETLAKVWQTSVEDVAQITTRNTHSLFSRMALM